MRGTDLPDDGRRPDDTKPQPRPPVPDRKTEPFIYIPPPPAHWIAIRVRTIHDVVVILMGSLCILSQVYKDVVQHRSPTYWILVAGLTCFGYEGAVWRDRRKQDEREANGADRR